jgi:hypothetical protein
VVVAMRLVAEGGGVALFTARHDVSAFVVHDSFSGYLPPPHLWEEVWCFQWVAAAIIYLTNQN